MAGITERHEVLPAAGQEATEEAEPVLHPFEPGLHQCGQLSDVVPDQADLLVLAPWLIFGAALAVICYRLVARRRASRRHRPGDR